jgi:Flp pilus assembly protein TadD
VQIAAVLHYRLLKLQAVVLMALGRKRDVLPRLKRMLQLQPADKYALASQAHLQAEQLQFEAAIASLHLLTSAWPQDGPAWFNLGYVLQQTGRHEDAEPAFRCALALDPLMDRAWYGLALALMQRQQFNEAAEALKKNTALQPMSPYGWYRLAEVWLALDQLDEAQKVVRHLHQFEPAVAGQLERQYRAAFNIQTALDGTH